ncbi:glycosyltransferase family 4 protein [Anabaena subtropica]|uniref:Glycosyltransferase family 4 protein n=1 Tax=Anabaena subtropica FACHB-260 TaxID=2692884 RepID=A0ABR8CM42_9NOST|nr:glycosyltransferase family 4 protein [Anabaena subtropica]MBD2343488.1 glycosyltransferase family 4 protein [Anabaena subtropica FACHB-260]
MKILHLSTYDTYGGAAIATYRLYNGLQKIGVNSQMLVQVKFSNNNSITAIGNKIVHKYPKVKPHLDSLPKLLFRHIDKSQRTSYSLQWLPDSMVNKIEKIDPDIIHLHWISGGFINIETIAKLNKPIIWTLQDMWAFTGGCHYSQECKRYQQSCGKCPQMPKRFNIDLSRWVWERKEKAWSDLNFTIVTPSNWLAECAKSSSLFSKSDIKIIPNSLDISTYKPTERKTARNLLNLPQNKYLVLFGAVNAIGDKRKGFHLLQPALQKMSQSGWKDKIELIIFGSSQPENPVNLGFKVHYMGKISDETKLALLYSSADVMIVPSIEEAFGQTASESLACGTPVVSFDSTGLKDIVEHQQNGYRAKCFSYDDLANGIVWVIENKERHQKLCVSACETVKQKFTLELQAKNYLSLYQNILKINS